MRDLKADHNVSTENALDAVTMPEILGSDNLLVQLYCGQEVSSQGLATVSLLNQDGTERYILEVKAGDPASEQQAARQQALRGLLEPGCLKGGWEGFHTIERALASAGYEMLLTIPENGIRDLSYGELSAMSDRLEKRLNQDLLDGLTGLRTRAALYSGRSVAGLNDLFAGEKFIFTLDFDHVRLADRFGFGKELEEVFKFLTEAGRQTFAANGISFEIFRIGGDEFAVLLGGNQKPDFLGKTVDAFRLKVAEKKRELFEQAASDQSRGAAYADANQAAALRETMRRIRKEFCSICLKAEDITKEKYEIWLREQFADMPGLQRFGGGELELQCALSICRRQQGDSQAKAAPSRLMEFTVSDVVQLGQEISPGQLSCALGFADLSVKKRKGSAKPPLFVPLNPSIQERESSRAARALVDQVETSLRDGFELLQRRETDGQKSLIERYSFMRDFILLWASDPSLKMEVQRPNYLAGLRAGDILGIDGAKTYAAIECDIKGFSSYNLEGEARADAILNDVLKVGRDRYEGVLLVRKGGGRTYLLVPSTAPARSGNSRELIEFALSIAKRMEGESEQRSRALRYSEHAQKIRGELGKITFEGEQALLRRIETARSAGAKPAAPLKPVDANSAQVDIRIVEIKPEDDLCVVFDRVARSEGLIAGEGDGQV